MLQHDLHSNGKNHLGKLCHYAIHGQTKVGNTEFLRENKNAKVILTGKKSKSNTPIETVTCGKETKKEDRYAQNQGCAAN